MKKTAAGKKPVWHQDLTGVDALVARVNQLRSRALKAVGGKRGKSV